MIKTHSKPAKFIAPGMIVKRLHCRAIEQSWSGEIGSDRVDRAAGVIRGVKIIGLQSNVPARFIGMQSDDPYTYDEAALRDAVHLYEGATVNVDHPKLRIDGDGRRVPEPSWNLQSDRKFGWLAGVRFNVDGLYADLHFLKSHPLAERVCEAAERNPRLFCLSHNADIRPEFRQGKVAVVEILSVESVDLIGAKGGTTISLYESGVDMLPEDQAETAVEMDGADGTAVPAKVSVADAFRTLKQAVLDDETLVSSEAIKLVEALETSLAEKASASGDSEGSAEAGGDGESGDGEKPAAGTESSGDTKGAIRAIEAAGVRVTAARIEAYESASGPVRSELVAGWKSQDSAAAPVKKAGAKPASRPAMESGASGKAEAGPKPASIDSFRS